MDATNNQHGAGVQKYSDCSEYLEHDYRSPEYPWLLRVVCHKCGTLWGVNLKTEKKKRMSEVDDLKDLLDE